MSAVASAPVYFQARIGSMNRVTVPLAVVETLGLRPGDLVQVSIARVASPPRPVS